MGIGICEGATRLGAGAVTVFTGTRAGTDAGTTARGSGCGLGAWATVTGFATTGFGFGAGLGATTTLGSGFATGSGAGAALAKVGCAPQICSRARVNRGIHVTLPSTPARIYTHPRLSTYCFPLNDAGGNSAGNAAPLNPWANTPEPPRTRATTADETNFGNDMEAPTKDLSKGCTICLFE